MQLVIGFGGNVGDVERAFRAARVRLAEAAHVVRASGLYRTPPVGPPGQAAYLNAAVLVAWPGPPVTLLDMCLNLEREAGRDRAQETRWGPRPLDLDLLAADGVVCRGDRLELPHPRLAERGFALVPAADVAGGWVHPVDGRTLEDHVRRLPDAARCAVTRVAARW